jgi:MtrB/PioB family decaheme-associated outer membrane protein
MVQTILRVDSSRDKGETEMARTKMNLVASLTVVLMVFVSSWSHAQVDVGDFTISGEAEIGGMPRHKNGDTGKFEEYRDIPESVIVPQLQLMIGSKKQDFYFEFDSSKLGRDDQNYRMRFGRYGLLDVEFEWDQIPHVFNVDTARTPYLRSNDGGTLTLPSRPSPITLGTSCAVNTVCQWLNSTAQPVDLSLYNGIGRFKVRYTPTPGWTFTGNYWSNNNSGTRAFGSLFGTSPGNYNITELVEPISYNTNNVELGGEYAGNGWSVGLKYNASFFHNNVSTLIWDNPIHTTGAGGCVDSPTWSGTGATGPCRGRLDLYPSNQAHTFTLSGAASLPMKTHFMGTVSYGWRLQDDQFLPATINSSTNGGIPLRISNSSLDGDVRPLMVNATVVNNSIDRLSLKGFYRFYDLGNHSRKITLTDGWINLDGGTPQDVGDRLSLHSYSKHDIGLEAGYDITRWLKAKFAYGYERLHRADLDVSNSNEHTIGPTFDLKPSSWLLFRATYKHSWRDAPNYDQTDKRFFEAQRDRDRVSLFSEITPWEKLSLHAGFEFTGDTYPDTTFGTQNDFNYSPSIGLLYAPAEWIKFFADYNWDRFDWRLDARATSPWFSRGRDQVNTFSLGSDVEIIRNLLGLRLQYGFSDGVSKVHASGNTGGNPPAANYPSIINRWHEVLARLEYKLHKNVSVNFGYYYNGYHSKDFGVDIMKPFMGDVDVFPTPNVNVQRSIFLGDQLKGSYTAHVGFLGLKLKF